MSKVRLQKLIAQAGICSRRKAEDLIVAGKVKLNGKTVNELGVKADPEKDKIEADGVVVQAQRKVYFLLNKPPGYITSANDEAGRPVVYDLIDEKRRLVSAGRLDFNTEGALLLTNDGELVHNLTHPSREVPKEYEVKIKGSLNETQVKRIRDGVLLEDGKAHVMSFEFARHTEKNSWYEVVLSEGRNREVRRILEAVGAQVLKLKRLVFAGLTVENIPLGDSRPLTPAEVLTLYELAGITHFEKQPSKEQVVKNIQKESARKKKFIPRLKSSSRRSREGAKSAQNFERKQNQAAQRGSQRGRGNTKKR